MLDLEDLLIVKYQDRLLFLSRLFGLKYPKINSCFNLKSALIKNTGIIQTADVVILLTSTNFDKMSM